eukprot:Nk52_evm6s311 gene=Nk52_evmTU6s311
MNAIGKREAASFSFVRKNNNKKNSVVGDHPSEEEQDTLHNQHVNLLDGYTWTLTNVLKNSSYIVGHFQDFSFIFLYILCTIEILQLLYFVFPKDDAIAWDSSLVGWLSQICTFLSFAFVQELNELGVLALLGVALIIMISVPLLIYFNLKYFYANHGDLEKLNQHWSTFILTLLCLFLTNVLQIPLIMICFSTAFCVRLDIDSCTEGLGIPIIILGWVTLIPTMTLTFTICLTFYPLPSTDMEHQYPLAKIHGRLEAFVFILRMILGLVYSTVSIVSMPAAGVIVVVITSLAIYLSYVLYMPFSSFKANKVKVIMYFIYLWGGICMALTSAFGDGKDNGSALVFYTGIFASYLTSVGLLMSRKAHLLKTKIASIRDPYEAELKIRLLLQEVNMDSENVEKYKHIGKGVKKDLLLAVEKYWEASVKKFPDSAYLHVALGNFCLLYYSNTNMAYCAYASGTGLNSKFDEVIGMEKMLLRLLLEYKALEKNEEIIKYQLYLIYFNRAIEHDKRSSKYMADFCDEVITTLPRIKVINETVREIKENNIRAEQNYAKCLAMRPNLELFLRYASFLSYAKGAEDKGKRFFIKADSLQFEEEKLANSKLLTDEKSLFTDFRSGILVVSSSDTDLGKIVHANQRAAYILGYQSMDLIGMHIADLVPHPYSSYHHEAMKDYTAGEGTKSFLGKGRVMHALHSDGFLVSIELVVKEMTDGTIVPKNIVILRPCLDSYPHIIFVDYATSKVINCNRACASLFRAQRYEIDMGKVEMSKWFPGFEDFKTELVSSETPMNFNLTEKGNIEIELSAKLSYLGNTHLLVCSVAVPDRLLFDADMPMEFDTYQSGVSYEVDGVNENGNRACDGEEDLKIEESRSKESGIQSQTSVGRETSEVESGAELTTFGLKTLDKNYKSNRSVSFARRGSNQASFAEMEEEERSSHSGKSSSLGEKQKDILYSTIQIASEKGNLNRSKMMRRFHLTLIFCILFTIVLSAVFYIVSDKSKGEYTNNVSALVRGSSKRESTFLRLAYLSRTLYFLHMGYYQAQPSSADTREINLNTLEADTREALKRYSNELQQEEDNLESQSSLIEGDAGMALFGFNIFTVDKEETATKVSSDNLKNSILQVSSRAQALSETPLINITANNPDYFYIVENAPTSIYTSAQASVNATNVQIQSSVDNGVLVERWLAISCVCVLLFIFFTVVVRTIQKVIKSKNYIFQKYSDFVDDVKIVLYHRAHTRHNILTAKKDFSEDMSVVFDSHPETVFPENISFKKTKVAPDTKMNISIYLKMFMFYLLSIGFFITAFFAIIEPVSPDKKTFSTTLQNVELQDSMMIRTLFWTREYAMATDTLFFTPLEEITEELAALDVIRKAVGGSSDALGTDGSLFRSGDNFNVIFKNGCTDASNAIQSCASSNICCTNIYEKVLSSGGIYGGLKQYLEEASAYLNSLNSTLDTTTATDAHRKAVLSSPKYQTLELFALSYVSNAIFHSLDLYIDESEDSLKQQSNIVLFLFIALIILTLVFYFAVFVNIVAEMSASVSNAKSSFALLPRPLFQAMYDSDPKGMQKVLGTIFSDDLQSKVPYVVSEESLKHSTYCFQKGDGAFDQLNLKGMFRYSLMESNCGDQAEECLKKFDTSIVLAPLVLSLKGKSKDLQETMLISFVKKNFAKASLGFQRCIRKALFKDVCLFDTSSMEWQLAYSRARSGNLNNISHPRTPTIPNLLDEGDALLTMHFRWLLASTLKADAFLQTRQMQPVEWLLLYSSKEDGLSVNRLRHYTLGYKGSTIMVIEDADGGVYGCAVDTEWEESTKCWGGAGCLAFQLKPYFCVASGSSKEHERLGFMYMNFVSRSSRKGLGIGGGIPEKSMLWIDEGFGTLSKHFGYFEDSESGISQIISVCPKQSRIKQIEVYGTAGLTALKDQQKLREWEKSFTERNAKVKRPGRWEDSPDIAILQMGGVKVDHRNEKPS